jgi:hypothetical protein
MRARSSIPFSLTASVATLALVGLVGYAALVGHEQASQPRAAAPQGHHMASLGEISALLKKSQGDGDR